MQNITAIVLAAGKGTRMKSSIHKCLHKICGEPIILYPIKACFDAGIKDFIVVSGNQRETFEAEVKKIAERPYFEGVNIEFAYQEEQNGTAHAFETAYNFATQKSSNPNSASNNDFIIINGDSVFITTEEINGLVNVSEGNMVSFSGAMMNDAKGCGRIVENEFNYEIVEEAYATEEQKLIREVNAGLYFVRNNIAKQAIDFCKQKAHERKSEEFLVDIVSAFTKDEVGINVVKSTACSNVNNRYELVMSEEQKIIETNLAHIENGVTVHLPGVTIIGPLVQIAQDVEIMPNCVITGDTNIESGTTVFQNSTIHDANIGADNSIGPNAYIREGTETGKSSKIGSFVETKKAKLGDSTKVPHLSYLGDCEIGDNTNFGAGAITANYDGTHKHKTTIGSDVKVGAGTTFVAPVELKNKSITGANAVILDNVDVGETVVGVPAKKITKKVVTKTNKGEENSNE